MRTRRFIIARSERYYTGLRDDSELRIKLSGNFEAIVGEQDTFCAYFCSYSHVMMLYSCQTTYWSTRIIPASTVHGRRFQAQRFVFARIAIAKRFLCFFPVQPSLQHEKAHDALRPFLQSRATQLAQEFAFLPTSPPREEGGIFELRAYQLNPGTLLEWEATW